jgi:hypothetical protein
MTDEEVFPGDDRISQLREQAEHGFPWLMLGDLLAIEEEITPQVNSFVQSRDGRFRAAAMEVLEILCQSHNASVFRVRNTTSRSVHDELLASINRFASLVAQVIRVGEWPEADLAMLKEFQKHSAGRANTMRELIECLPNEEGEPNGRPVVAIR